MKKREDDEYVEDFENPITLSWECYTSFEEIKPDHSITTYFLYPKNELDDSILNDCKSWFDKIGYFTHLNFEQYQLDILDVSKNNEKIGILYSSMGCLIIRQLSKEDSLASNFIKNNNICKLNSIAKVPHIETEENVENYSIRHRTGIFDDDLELLPRTFFHLKYGNQLLGRALVEYIEGEFGVMSSTLLMFEIEEDFRGMSHGRTLLNFIENKMREFGFDTLYLADTRSMDFWRRMGYEIDIDEGWKDL